jgi:hypothetical protein
MSIVQQCNADPCADKLNLALGAYRTEVRAPGSAAPLRRARRARGLDGGLLAARLASSR